MEEDGSLPEQFGTDETASMRAWEAHKQTPIDSSYPHIRYFFLDGERIVEPHFPEYLGDLFDYRTVPIGFEDFGGTGEALPVGLGDLVDLLLSNPIELPATEVAPEEESDENAGEEGDLPVGVQDLPRHQEALLGEGGPRRGDFRTKV